MAAWARRARGVLVFYVIFCSPILLAGGFGESAGGVVFSGGCSFARPIPLMMPPVTVIAVPGKLPPPKARPIVLSACCVLARPLYFSSLLSTSLLSTPPAPLAGLLKGTVHVTGYCVL